MIDEAGVGGGESSVEGIDPIIVFNPDEMINTQSVKPVSYADSSKASKKHEQWYKKARRNYKDW